MYVPETKRPQDYRRMKLDWARLIKASFFQDFDLDSDGKIDAHEFKEFLMKYGEVLTEEEALDIITIGDTDRDGKLNVDEFIRLLQEFDSNDA